MEEVFKIEKRAVAVVIRAVDLPYGVARFREAIGRFRDSLSLDNGTKRPKHPIDKSELFSFLLYEVRPKAVHFNVIDTPN